MVAHFKYTVNIDLMASRTNCQVPQFMSWRPEPNAIAVDAFAADWRSLNFCCFPPFSIILRTIGEIRQDQATGLLVVPFWPTQSWFPVLMQHLIEHPCVLPRRQKDAAVARKATCEPSSPRQAPVASMQVARRSLQGQGLSPQTTDIVLAAWRPATSKQYGWYFTKWTDHCREQQSDPLHPSLPQVLNFLTTLYTSGLGYGGYISTLRSLLFATLVTLPGGHSL